MKPRTRPCAIPWAAGDGQYQSGAHGAVTESAGMSPLAGPETRWPIPRADTAGPDAHSLCSDGWNPAGLKGEPVAMAFTLPEGGRGTFKPTHHQESHGVSIPGKQPCVNHKRD
ncbi:MAG: hypothetical protein OXC57_03325 [Rhodobacteraceae bacterium]|nr:hypothetical protein [Paracoccaceae bacterium]